MQKIVSFEVKFLAGVKTHCSEVCARSKSVHRTSQIACVLKCSSSPVRKVIKSDGPQPYHYKRLHPNLQGRKCTCGITGRCVPISASWTLLRWSYYLTYCGHKFVYAVHNCTCITDCSYKRLNLSVKYNRTHSSCSNIS